jgi:hypothetical protein
MRSVLTLILQILSFDFQSSRKTKPAERKVTKAIKGQLLSIRSRIATVAAAVRTSVAQIEFAASQKRQQVTKLEEKERDGSAEIRLRTAAGAKLLMYRLTLVDTLIVVLGLLERIRISLLAITKSSIERFVLTHQAPGKRNVPLCCFKPGTDHLPLCGACLFQQGLDKKLRNRSILLLLNHQRSDLVYAF